jgi:multidrug efflux system membrane fusion protein
MSDRATRGELRELARAELALPAPETDEPALPAPETDEPAAPALPEQKEGEAVATGADPEPDGNARYRRRVLLTLGAIALALVVYWGSGYVLAYTDDAYVTSDLVAVAPQISGRTIAVPIVDNQTVTKGQPLAEIDPTLFS